MTSKISLFNKAIYKSTIKRYLWGAIVYFALLFLTTCVSILLGHRDIHHYHNSKPVILGYGYTIFPMMLAFGVSAVTAVLVYRFAHSRRTALFVHSLPVSRNENFVSSLLGGFTLMGAPVILNGMILMVISLCGYGCCFDMASCFTWIGINLLALFLFFSCSTFAAMITGHTFGAIVINILLHSFMLILTGGFSLLAEAFLYGYNDYSVFMNSVTEWNFVVYVFGDVIRLGDIFTGEVDAEKFNWLKFTAMAASAVVLYALSWFLYKKRRMENSGSIAAFNCLNPIYKYMITLFVALISFGISISTWRFNSVFAIVPVIIQSSVTYFGVEMILKKSVRIWRSYKGYLAFAAAFAAVVCIFAFTSFFGFETRVPSPDSVASVKMNDTVSFSGFYSTYADEKFVENKDVIQYITDFHRSHLAENDIPVLNHTDIYEDSCYVEFEYKLKNGGTLKRKYRISTAEYYTALNELYSYDDFKMTMEEVLVVKDENITEIETPTGIYITDKKEIAELMDCIRQDMLELNYTQLHQQPGYGYNVTIQHRTEYDGNDIDYDRLWYTDVKLNSNFARTNQWLHTKTLAESIKE